MHGDMTEYSTQRMFILQGILNAWSQVRHAGWNPAECFGGVGPGWSRPFLYGVGVSHSGFFETKILHWRI